MVIIFSRKDEKLHEGLVNFYSSEFVYSEDHLLDSVEDEVILPSWGAKKVKGIITNSF
jgi:hypothetical protein